MVMNGFKAKPKTQKHEVKAEVTEEYCLISNNTPHHHHSHEDVIVQIEQEMAVLSNEKVTEQELIKDGKNESEKMLSSYTTNETKIRAETV